MAKGAFRGGGYGGMGGMNQMQMMKQAQKMQEELLKMQEQLEQTVYTATAGGGVVTATVSGKRELTALEIDPDAVDPEDVEMLQDMVIAAVNEALRTANADKEETMGKISGGMNLGGLGGLGGLF